MAKGSFKHRHQRPLKRPRLDSHVELALREKEKKHLTRQQEEDLLMYGPRQKVKDDPYQKRIKAVVALLKDPKCTVLEFAQIPPSQPLETTCVASIFASKPRMLGKRRAAKVAGKACIINKEHPVTRMLFFIRFLPYKPFPV